MKATAKFAILAEEPARVKAKDKSSQANLELA